MKQAKFKLNLSSEQINEKTQKTEKNTKKPNQTWKRRDNKTAKLIFIYK